MKVEGKKTIEANRETVWNLLQNPDILRAAIPGCKSLDKTGESSYRFEIELKVAAIVGKYSGGIEIINPEPPQKYGLKIEGSGPLGHMQSVVNIQLNETDEESLTEMVYEGEAEIGGKVAKVGQRVLSGVASLVTNQFFGAFAKQIEQHASL